MNEELIVKKLIEHDEQLSYIRQNMFTRDDGRKMMDILEGIATVVKKIQEDHTFAIEWLKRLQTQVERQQEDIQKIKVRLQMV